MYISVSLSLYIYIHIQYIYIYIYKYTHNVLRGWLGPAAVAVGERDQLLLLLLI